MTLKYWPSLIPQVTHNKESCCFGVTLQMLINLSGTFSLLLYTEGVSKRRQFSNNAPSSPCIFFKSVFFKIELHNEVPFSKYTSCAKEYTKCNFVLWKFKAILCILHIILQLINSSLFLDLTCSMNICSFLDPVFYSSLGSATTQH